MRVTQGMVLDRLLANLSFNQRRLQETNSAITSGKRVQRPADDPIAVAQSLGLAGDLRQVDQYRRNIVTIRGWLQATEEALGHVTDLIQRARELAITGANETLSQTQRSNIAAEVQQLFQRGIDLGNTTHSGRYIFAGFQVATPPYQASGNPEGFVYLGDGGKLQQEFETNRTVPINVPGGAVFPSALAALRELLDGLNISNPGQIRSSIGALDAAVDAVLATRAEVGARQERVSAADEGLQDARVTLQKELSSAVDVDLAQALVEFNAQQNVYQASLKASTLAIQPSLLDFFR
ncbi:MAG: flagellar hook-associated protein FlgL [Chloroflexi bacterium]|nr:flagellar hook-associated protein FlgL [Chloroflexota bacterium]